MAIEFMRKSVLQAKFIFSAISIALFVFCFLIESKPVFAQESLSPQIRQALPQIEVKLSSPEPSDRLSILNQLVVRKRDYDVVHTELRFPDLPATDYAIVIKSLFDLDAKKNGFDDEAWWKMIFAIRKFGLKQFSGELADYLPKSNPPIQSFIIIALRYLKAAETAPKIAALPVWTAEYVRREAISALIAFGAKEAVSWLIPLLSDKNPYVRSQAAQNLAKVNELEAAPTLAKLIGDPDENVRYSALDALIKLNARSQAVKIWHLVNSNQRKDIEGYAIAALLYFEQHDAIPLAIGKIKNVAKSETSDDRTLEYLYKLKPKFIVSKIIFLLESREKYLESENEEARFRGLLLRCLLEFKARDAIPVFRKHLYHGNEVNQSVVATLGDLRATEATNDLLNILNQIRYDTNGEATNQTYEAAEAAVALAKIGDPKTWKRLIDVAEYARFPYRNQVIIELNRKIDPGLWEKIQTAKVFGADFKSIKENSEIFSQESGVPIILEYQPGKDNFKFYPPDYLGYPNMRTGVEASLDHYLREIVKNIDEGTLPQRFTFIFDAGRVRILTVEKAVEWWRKNILVK